MLYLVDVTGTLPSVSPLHRHDITIINNNINYNIITFFFFSFLAIQGNGKGIISLLENAKASTECQQ